MGKSKLIQEMRQVERLTRELGRLERLSRRLVVVRGAGANFAAEDAGISLAITSLTTAQVGLMRAILALAGSGSGGVIS